MISIPTLVGCLESSLFIAVQHRSLLMRCRMKARLVCLSLMLVLVLATGSMFAQVNTASLTGLITDPSGAAIADAKVTATNTATNLQQSATTSSAGYYTFATLPLGEYRVSIEKQGFRVTASTIKLEVGARARLDLALQ